jgi:hypothetical protein
MSPRAELVKQISQPVVNQAGPHLWRRRSTRCRASSSPEATAFVHRQQQTWQPVLDEIAKNER